MQQLGETSENARHIHRESSIAAWTHRSENMFVGALQATCLQYGYAGPLNFVNNMRLQNLLYTSDDTHPEIIPVELMDQTRFYDQEERELSRELALLKVHAELVEGTIRL